MNEAVDCLNRMDSGSKGQNGKTLLDNSSIQMISLTNEGKPVVG